MVIKGIVQDGVIRIDVKGILPEGACVLVTPVESPPLELGAIYDLQAAKAKLREIIDLPSLGPSDGFSGANHDKVLYGDAE